MAGHRKQEIITFKVDQSLWEQLQGVPNRSEFIRSAIQAALEGACPLCEGTGTLTADQRRHWNAFAEKHSLKKCDDCRAVHLVCLADDEAPRTEQPEDPSAPRSARLRPKGD